MVAKKKKLAAQSFMTRRITLGKLMGVIARHSSPNQIRDMRRLLCDLDDEMEEYKYGLLDDIADKKATANEKRTWKSELRELREDIKAIVNMNSALRRANADYLAECKAKGRKWVKEKEARKINWTYRLTHSRATDEWVVIVYKDGKRYEPGCYYTDDKEDAVNTMAEMKKQIEVSFSLFR